MLATSHSQLLIPTALHLPATGLRPGSSIGLSQLLHHGSTGELSAGHRPIPASICPIATTVNQDLSLAIHPQAAQQLAPPTDRPLPADVTFPKDQTHTTPANTLLHFCISHGLSARRPACPDLLNQLALAQSALPKFLVCSFLSSDGHPDLTTALADGFPQLLASTLAALAQHLQLRLTVAVSSDRPPRPLLSALSRAKARVVNVDNIYPAADPTLLLLQATGVRLLPNHSPASAGVILLDAPALYDLARILLLHTSPPQPADLSSPWHLVPLWISHPPATPALFWTLPGSRPDQILTLQSADLWQDALPRQLRRPVSQPVDDGPRLWHIRPALTPTSPQSCLRCGWCADICPTRCRPALFLQAAQEYRLNTLTTSHADTPLPESAYDAGLSSCIQCGLCNYICPSGLDLLQSIRHLTPPLPLPLTLQQRTTNNEPRTL